MKDLLPLALFPKGFYLCVNCQRPYLAGESSSVCYFCELALLRLSGVPVKVSEVTGVFEKLSNGTGKQRR
jgi:hypothetical protein